MSKILVNETSTNQDLFRERVHDPSRQRYRFAQRFLPPRGDGLRLVDVGGGRGEFTTLARERGFSTVLLDGNSSSVDHEREKGHEAKQVDLNHRLEGIDDASFDFASCLDVIEHIVPSEQLLSEISRILKPGGVLLLSTPNFSYIKDRISYVLGRNVREEGYHFRFFTRSSLLQAVAAAGFVQTESQSMAYPLLVRKLARLATFGSVRMEPFACPRSAETWLAATFVWKLRKDAGL